MSITNDPHSMYGKNNIHIVNMREYQCGMSVQIYFCYTTYIIRRFLSWLHHSEFLDDHFYTTCRHCLQHNKRLWNCKTQSFAEWGCP